MQCYEAERGAYGNLVHLQGSVIPGFIGSGYLELPEERAIDVPLIIPEYIPDSVTLHDVPSSVVRAINTTNTSFSVLTAVDTNVDDAAIEDAEEDESESDVKTGVRAQNILPSSVLKAVDTNVETITVGDDSSSPKVNTGVPWLDYRGRRQSRRTRRNPR
ncbi:hypothetical protein BDP27DRAFT_1328958 [Rhodocollybia butyracea]|uniref:Uncharacterized protein n=1 Tax=Rhodocollybia butyracea TaxID=206335 RepID=A0A9P5PPZ5_9AGAR|nr:hypothetical protein BDP27DRAFT_1328958 [Rhodocollybia butyracea]